LCAKKIPKNKNTIMRKNGRIISRLLASLFVCFLVHTVKAQQLTVSLRKAIDLAVENNLSLRSDSLNVAVTGHNNKELAGYYLPQINYNSVTEFNPEVASQLLPGKFLGDPSKDLVPVQMGTTYNLRTGVEVTQALYRKDILVQMRAAGLYSNIAKTKHKLTKEQLIYNVAYSFFAIQAKADLIRTTTEDYLNLKDVLRIAKAQYENGVIKGIDYHTLQINVSNKEASLSQLETEYMNQLADFNYLLGLPADTKVSIADSISAEMTIPQQKKQTAERNDILLTRQMVESKQVDIKKIRAELTPSINSYLRYNYQAQFNNADKVTNSDYWFRGSTIGLSVAVPIFDGNRRRNRIKAAELQLDQLKYQSTLQQQKAEVEYLNASYVLTNSLQQADITRKNLQLAVGVFNSRKALYNEGVSSLVELLDAERELTNARKLSLQADVNVKTGWLDLHKANGTLLTDFIKSI
jgi:outer membrane protein TolC